MVVTELVDSFSFSRKLCITHITVNHTIVMTVQGTCRRSKILYNSTSLGVSIRRYNLLCNEYLITNRAVISLGKTCCRTSRCYCIVYNLCMTNRRYNYLHTAKLFTANRTINCVIVRAGVGTAGSDIILYNHASFAVSKCRNETVNITITAMAGVLGISLLGAGWSNHFDYMIVSDGFANHARFNHLIAL